MRTVLLALLLALSLPVLPTAAHADDGEEALSAEKLKALQAWKRGRLWIQDVSITTVYSNGGTSHRMSWRIQGGTRDAYSSQQFMEALGDAEMLARYQADLKRHQMELGISMGVGGGLIGVGAILTGVQAPKVQAAEEQYSGAWNAVDLNCYDLDSDRWDACQDEEDRQTQAIEDDAEATIQRELPGMIVGISLMSAGGTVMGVAAYAFAWKRAAKGWVGGYYDKSVAQEAIDEHNLELARELGLSEEEARMLILKTSAYNPRRPRIDAEPMFGFNFVGVRGTF